MGPEGNELLNEIDTGNDKFFISKESVDSARKYGYKILLKKINGKEVPVGKIKFSFPTLVEIGHIEDEAVEEGEDESVDEEEYESNDEEYESINENDESINENDESINENDEPIE